MIEWKIYYEDGACIEGNSETALPADKRMGVMVVVYREPTHNWGTWHKKDYYIYTFGFIDNMLHKCEHIKYALAGRTVSDEAYDAAFVRAKSECDPPKTGQLERE
jgi:hypothetical protein